MVDLEATVRGGMVMASWNLSRLPEEGALTSGSFYQIGKVMGHELHPGNITDLQTCFESLEIGHLSVQAPHTTKPVFFITDCICSPSLNAGRTICYLQAGLLAGALEEVWGRATDLVEVRCRGLGDEVCEFHVVAPGTKVISFREGERPNSFDRAIIFKFLSHLVNQIQLERLATRAPRDSGTNRPGRRHEMMEFANGARFSLRDILGRSPAVGRLKEITEKAAQTDFTVLIQGESGTGKELVAHAIHNLGRRSKGPFVTVNCGAIPEQLLEAELFGYEEGSFTGARRGGKPGKIEQANGGTLFLDEIGDMPLPMQTKLLRVLQYGELEKVGATRKLTVDARIIAATHRDLAKLVQQGSFRSDLYYRLNVIRIDIPPLRERKEDIPMLASIFLKRLSQKYPELRKDLSYEAMMVLQEYSWPGNVREMENVLERLFSLTNHQWISAEDVRAFLDSGSITDTRQGDKLIRNTMSNIERDLICKALKEAGGNKTLAAQILGISRSTLYAKLKAYGFV